MTKGTSDTVDDLEAVRVIVDALGKFQTAEQQRILRWAQEKLGLASQAVAPVVAQHTEPERKHPGQHASVSTGTDIKTFIEKKKPKSDLQFTAAVAYYHQFESPPGQRKESINSADLQDACRMVGRTRMKRPAQTLVNAHQQGLLDRRETGNYAISTVGENLVAVALPSAEGKARPRPNAKRKSQRGKSTAKAKKNAKRPRR